MASPFVCLRPRSVRVPARRSLFEPDHIIVTKISRFLQIEELAGGGRLDRGERETETDPSPSLLSTTILPPWSSTTGRAMARPEAGAPVVALGKTTTVEAIEDPGQLGPTKFRIPYPAPRPRSDRSPSRRPPPPVHADGVKRIAFSIRLTRARSIKSDIGENRRQRWLAATDELYPPFSACSWKR